MIMVIIGLYPIFKTCLKTSMREPFLSLHRIYSVETALRPVSSVLQPISFFGLTNDLVYLFMTQLISPPPP